MPAPTHARRRPTSPPGRRRRGDDGRSRRDRPGHHAGEPGSSAAALALAALRAVRRRRTCWRARAGSSAWTCRIATVELAGGSAGDAFAERAAGAGSCAAGRRGRRSCVAAIEAATRPWWPARRWRWSPTRPPRDRCRRRPRPIPATPSCWPCWPRAITAGADVPPRDDAGADELKVVPTTVHIPLSAVPGALTRALLVDTIRTRRGRAADGFRHRRARASPCAASIRTPARAA